MTSSSPSFNWSITVEILTFEIMPDFAVAGAVAVGGGAVGAFKPQTHRHALPTKRILAISAGETSEKVGLPVLMDPHLFEPSTCQAGL